MPEIRGWALRTIASREDLRKCRCLLESDLIDPNGQGVGTEKYSLVLVILRTYLMRLNDGSAFGVTALLMNTAIRNE